MEIGGEKDGREESIWKSFKSSMIPLEEFTREKMFTSLTKGL
jgi:hypothetical protein